MTRRFGRFWRLRDLLPSTRYSAADDRTEGGTIVPPWPATIAYPGLGLTSSAQQGELIRALATGLDSAGFSIADTCDDGFRATRVPWLDVVTLQAWGRTIIAVEIVAAHGAPTSATVSVTLGYEHSGAKHRAVDGLNEALDALRSRGHEMSVSDWSPSRRV